MLSRRRLTRTRPAVSRNQERKREDRRQVRSAGYRDHDGSADHSTEVCSDVTDQAGHALNQIHARIEEYHLHMFVRRDGPSAPRQKGTAITVTTPAHAGGNRRKRSVTGTSSIMFVKAFRPGFAGSLERESNATRIRLVRLRGGKTFHRSCDRPQLSAISYQLSAVSHHCPAISSRAES